ncbi:MAG: dihydrolipoyllysine-residue acetyltransferase [Solirubrobacteraceae bacterium]
MSAATRQLNVTVPDIGDFGAVPVIEILVSVGDTVVLEDPLITLESDKATMDVPSPAAGTVTAIHVKVGDKVSEGTLIVDLETTGEEEDPAQTPPAPAGGVPAASPAPADGAPVPPAEIVAQRASQSALATATDVTTRVDESAQANGTPAQPPRADRETGNTPASEDANRLEPVYASPSVRRIARELGVDLHRLHGTGRKGRLTPEDVRSAHAQEASVGAPNGVSGTDLNLAPWPTVDFEMFGETERVQRTRIQRISALNLARNWVVIPHVTQNDEADITELEAWRAQLNAEHSADGVKFTVLTFLIAASVATLKAFPTFNSSLDGEELVLKHYFNIGFATDTPNGLVVPVIRGADGKGLVQIARELGELSAKAREGKLSRDEMSSGTFSISSLGGIGGTSFTPIINAPEVAILGVTRAAIKPVWSEAQQSFTPRLMLPLSLSYDHRVIDGASAARFVVHLATVLGDLRRVLL